MTCDGLEDDFSKKAREHYVLNDFSCGVLVTL